MDTLDELIGISAGKICYSNFDEVKYPLRKLIHEAEIVWESGRSAWTLLSQDVNGMTRWLSPDEDQVAIVLSDGNLHIEEIG